MLWDSNKLKSHFTTVNTILFRFPITYDSLGPVADFCAQAEIKTLSCIPDTLGNYDNEDAVIRVYDNINEELNAKNDLLKKAKSRVSYSVATIRVEPSVFVFLAFISKAVNNRCYYPYIFGKIFSRSFKKCMGCTSIGC